MEEKDEELLREKLLSDEEVRAMISTRAYEIYQGRGCEPGQAVEDWLQAENEILASLISEQTFRTTAESEQQVTDTGEAPARKKSRTRST